MLTGSRGSGKSTLLRALTGGAFPGITTRAEKGKAVFLKENGGETEIKIGVFAPDNTGTENRMAPVAAGFTELGIPALERCLSSESAWVSIDEIGYLEMAEPGYLEAIEKILAKKSLIAAVRKQNLPFLQEILSREDAFVLDLDRPFGNLGCVIMASGLGKRFGGDKLMAPFGDGPMIARILEATEGVFAKRVVVTRSQAAAKYCRERNINVVFHDLPYRSDTVRLGLEKMEGTDGCMFCPADQPLLRPDTVMALALSAGALPENIWRTEHAGEMGAPILFPGWCYEELRSLPQGKGGGYAAKNHPQQLRLLSVRDGFELMDADTSEALQKLLAYYAHRPKTSL